jgi:hypothetical protein
MKKAAGVAAVLLVIAFALYLVFGPKIPVPPMVVASTQNSMAGQPGSSPAAPVVSSTNPASSLRSLSPSQTRPQPASLTASAVQADSVADLPPATVLQNIGRAIHQYGDMFGGNPVGTNPEITSQLSGNNPKHINFITAQAGMRINADGELVDEWGTPYFFHQLSGTETEIHSAGPDKIMWTSDDLVMK